MDLVVPSGDLAAAWRKAHAEWGPGFHEDGFGLTADDDVASTQGFSDWVERLRADVECTYRWIVEGERVLGGVALRHDSHEFAADMGMTRVTAVCEVDNAASIATLARAGGEQVGRLGSAVRFRILCA
ncbi:GNAT family N-acetyltransferase [Rhodococcus fascians]|nr:GNAT family N-acetyltransferase [Rhodococcus fascians]MBY4116658.1 GNAT family N-acetyltransferase [Rhodococcus fascians]